MGLEAPSPVVAWMNLSEEGQKVSLAGEKRGTVHHAGLYMNCGDSRGAEMGTLLLMVYCSTWLQTENPPPASPQA